MWQLVGTACSSKSWQCSASMVRRLVGAEQALILTINNGCSIFAIGVGNHRCNVPVFIAGRRPGHPPPQIFEFSRAMLTDADAQQSYMVAVRKNDALTIAVSRHLGYQQPPQPRSFNWQLFVLQRGCHSRQTGDQEPMPALLLTMTAADRTRYYSCQNAVPFGSSVSTFARTEISHRQPSFRDRFHSSPTTRFGTHESVA